MTSAREQLLGLIFGSCCPGCGAPAEPICDSCLDRLIRSAALLGPLPFHECGATLSGATSGGSYGGALKSMVLSLKRGARRMAPPLWMLMRAAAGNDPDYCSPDCVCFVPSTRRRIKERGYNQAELLALLASRDLGVPLSHSLTKTIKTPDQDTLDGQGRRKNLVGAFECTREVAGSKVLLVDDVLTTGSTVRECASVLLDAGARSVFALVAARATLRN